ncbi:hypothetical protein K431DRAFT_286082 [Polychaeton citri CBS 116435]|uniref:Calponin-homology (CH) domain-containing protein n=1 Tax=Polychaeton citri CBS 116435 TaxID=1314669 RepID=A0A9P4Q5S0_9PEZI|nr:hypothetical protein K431DRAFT_286082 [Polychaeton citri CBS 116435]
MADITIITNGHANTSESPVDRSGSPSPSVSPSLALDAVPSLDRSVSTPTSSNSSILSSRSRQSRLSDGATSVVKRRGYMRPQGTAFADSARSRDSVMSLGSIAHMQYYFARTGLLDGKGAQLAREDKDRLRKKSSIIGGRENLEPSGAELDDLAVASLNLNDGSTSSAVSDSGLDASIVDSPTEISVDGYFGSGEPPMLPPTVSTYKQKPSFTEPLPDMPVLRRELKEALQDACKVLEESQTQQPAQDGSVDRNADGFHELQGLHLLDIITLAIRAARNYYTAHTDLARLYSLRSDKKLREDLFQVMDVLKRMASRNFKGGIRIMELSSILTWIEGIDKLIKKEEQIEQKEQEEREAYAWREGGWKGRERQREWLFLKSFDQGPDLLPDWQDPSDSAVPTTFLKSMQDGQRLITIHNTCVARSRRKFGEIKTWHTDVAKPYRMAENLRYWVKAAELRWEVKLEVPVSAIVNSSHENAWREFDAAIFAWCRAVRKELIEDWLQEKREGSRREKKVPELKIEGEDKAELDGNVVITGAAEETTMPEQHKTQEPREVIRTEA